MLLGGKSQGNFTAKLSDTDKREKANPGPDIYKKHRSPVDGITGLDDEAIANAAFDFIKIHFSFLLGLLSHRIQGTSCKDPSR
jgi:hypothetical protein